MSLIKTVVLADPGQTVPWPGVPGRLIPADEPITVSTIDPYWSALVTDGTLVEVPAQKTAPETPKTDPKA